MAYAIRTITVFWILAMSSYGCGINPKTLQPVAIDNSRNVAALVQNNKLVHNTALELLKSQGQVLKILQVRKLVLICDDDIVAGAAKANVKQNLDSKVAAIKQTQPKGSAQEVATLYPITGDVAGGLMTADRAVEMCWAVSTVITNRVAAPYGLFADTLKDVYVLKQWDDGQQALLEAYKAYIAQIDRQSSLALKDAGVFEEVSETKTDAVEVVRGAAQDQGIRDSVLGLISNPDRKRQATVVFDSISQAAAQADKNIPVK